jgi:hypothetical protein
MRASSSRTSLSCRGTRDSIPASPRTAREPPHAALPANPLNPRISDLRSQTSDLSPHTPTGNRTPVSWLRTRYPWPLDDGGAVFPRSRASWSCQSAAQHYQRHIGHRPGGTRTPNRRFWRPVLYQLSYGPTHGQGRSRTADTAIFSRVLYQLSYLASHTLQVSRSRPAPSFDEKPAPACRTRAGGPRGLHQ